MNKLVTILMLAALAVPLMGANCNTVVRDETVYRTELDFMEQTAMQPADKLVEWINLHCKCDAGKWLGDNAELCEKSAKLVQVIRVRVPYHKEMMLYNASITEKRPPKEPPAVPPTADLCPGS